MQNNPGETSNDEEYVDLGLSVYWANCNLGATKPEEYGGYYQWAGLEDVTNVSINLSEENCPYHIGSNEETGWVKYVSADKPSYWSGSGNPDNKMILDAADDVACMKLGDKWRIPTNEEWAELISSCKSEWTTMNGVCGLKFTSRKIGYTDKWIFLPATGLRVNGELLYRGEGGYYWSSTLTFYPSWARHLFFSEGNVSVLSSWRGYGQSIRPVSD